MVLNMALRAGALEEKIWNVIRVAPAKMASTPPVISDADRIGRTRVDSRWCSGMSTIASEAPRSTISIIDHRTITATRVRMPIMATGYSSGFRSECIT
jgi:hypothetical protein